MLKGMSKNDVCRDEDGKPKLCDGAEKKLRDSAKAAATAAH
jgi:hypothetical protein